MKLTTVYCFLKVTLDDSTIEIATTVSSRYMGPLKAHVDEWQKQLLVFQSLVSSKLSRKEKK